ncbi:DMT family transporter [Paenirhodobacter populi]|uniref:EamA-like transporter family protein n=1 Tax=Paenirhodobacter populi TaxID=2306993 RepID=A0A443IQA0_9RHOB|nr:DMT family transporter [Sinirhodobacter populi]RWR08546.1 EamA-like transporter family protein [Sinirhodobacter populi]
MATVVLLAFVAGMLVTLSRQINGRLAAATSALTSSFWNHAVGLGVLVAYTLVAGRFWPEGAADAPWYAWAGGVAGVVFVAGGSWVIHRLGAALTSGLLVAGQMLSGVMMDLIRGTEGSGPMRFAGVALILLGVWMSRRGGPRRE